MLAYFFFAHLYNQFFTRDGFWGWLCMLILQIILGDGAFSLKIERRRTP